ncbi:MAG: sigma-54-dependent Fis family transcriptional regulator, partial [Mucilaginibacter sp.]|nr:sigma-54-dependent Fis family transcriptional regulator [Mucilaginibacter sp.]
VANGRFREDLFYRLNIFPISIPALRERKGDIGVLAAHFIQRFAKKTGKKINVLSQRAIMELQQHPWPGNVRELEHFLERKVLITQDHMIRSFDLPAKHTLLSAKSVAIAPVKTIDENEREHIMHVLKLCNGRIGGKNGAAKLLGVPPTTLSSKLKRLGIRRGFNI